MYVQKPQKVHTLISGIDTIVHYISTINQNHLPVVLSIGGGSASGKTSQISNKIIQYCKNHHITTLHLTMDNYNIGQQEMKKKGMNLNNFDLPEVVDINLLNKHIQALKHKKTIQMPEYSFVNNGPTGHMIANKSADIIVLDGLFVNIEQRNLPVDFKVFVDCSMPGMIIRRLVRDTVQGGRKGQSPADCLRQIIETVLPSYITYVVPSRSRSDLIIENDFDPIKEPIVVDINDQSMIDIDKIVTKDIYPIYSSYARIMLFYQVSNHSKKYFFAYDDDGNHDDNTYSIHFEIDQDLYHKTREILQSAT